jgi:hypothetical protein
MSATTLQPPDKPTVGDALVACDMILQQEHSDYAVQVLKNFLAIDPCEKLVDGWVARPDNDEPGETNICCTRVPDEQILKDKATVARHLIDLVLVRGLCSEFEREAWSDRDLQKSISGSKLVLLVLQINADVKGESICVSPPRFMDFAKLDVIF